MKEKEFYSLWFSGVFAIGDCILFLDLNKKPFPPTAQLVESQAKAATKNLHVVIRNKEKENFVYKPKGRMAIIGKKMELHHFLE